MFEEYKDFKKRKITRNQKISILIGFCFLLMIVLFNVFLSPPKYFPVNQVVEIEKGSSLVKASQGLSEDGIVRHSRVLDFFVILLGGDKSIVAGEYSFERPLAVFEVANRIIKGQHGIDLARIKIDEGSTLEEIAMIFDEKLVNFDVDEFYSLTDGMEGYLFPDTYLFFVTAKTPDVVDKLLKTFDSKLEDLSDDIAKSGKNIDEIITMASIIQKEAYNEYLEQQTISGILWKRMEKGMRLQVDATLKYITGKPSSKLTKDDLADDHPYNTYTNDGLPPGPIGSPGLKAIKAAINPVDSPYYFYLHDNSGQVYYATTHDGHVANKRNYLR